MVTGRAFTQAPEEVRRYVIPLVVDGAGWRTTITLFSRSETRGVAALSAFDERGNPQLGSRLWPAHQSVQLGGFESVTLETDDVLKEIKVGWMQIDAPSNASGVVTFRQRLGANQEYATSVPLTTPQVRVFGTFDDSTAIALVNPSAARNVVYLRFRDTSGTVLVFSSIELSPRQQVTFVLSGRFPTLVGRHGTIELWVVDDKAPFGAIGFRSSGVVGYSPIFIQ